MNDIGLLIKNGSIDIYFDDMDFVTDDSLKTAVIISLFSDRRISKDEMTHYFSDRKGYWGDSTEVDKFKTGSKLWILRRGKKTLKLLEEVRAYCLEALDWMIEDGLANTIEIIPSLDGHDNLSTKILIDKIEYQFEVGGSYALQ